MAKRKRPTAAKDEAPPAPAPSKKSKKTEAEDAKAKSSSATASASTETIQIVVGSYDRILHGLTATIAAGKEEAEFADTFLFNAHTSAIRCVAVSPASAPAPGQAQKVLLASGSTDERINLYSLSAHPASRRGQERLAAAAGAALPRPVRENAKNRELGALLHHDASVTALRFPTRGKLLSASEDSSVAVTRTRDWSLLSAIRAPVPKAQGRPSGDTAAAGAAPSGVNDFAVHPSMKLMISVSRGERCMRLWNLVTGRKAGVLNFGRELLQEVGEGRHSTGEGRRVVWGSVDGADEFAVGFDRDVVVFSMDSEPKCRVMGTTRTKVHQFCYVKLDEESGEALLAVATEDGRIIFFSTQAEDLSSPEGSTNIKDGSSAGLNVAKMVGYVGGKDGGVSGRIKDLTALRSESDPGRLYLAAGSSDGKVRLWRVGVEELQKQAKGAPLGKLLGTYETQNRITCMAAFIMIPRPEGAEDSEEEEELEEVEAEAERDDDDGESSDGE